MNSREAYIWKYILGVRAGSSKVPWGFEWIEIVSNLFQTARTEISDTLRFQDFSYLFSMDLAIPSSQ